MKKAILYTFSGTGNTLLTAKMLAKNLDDRQFDTEVYEVRLPYENVPDPNDYDLVGFGYPIHAFNAPEVFVSFVKQLPAAREKKPTFYFKVSGEPFAPNNASSALIHKELLKKNYEPMLEKHFLMPYNVMFRYDDALAKQMYLYTRAMTEALAERIFRGERETLHYGLGTRIFAGILRIQWFGAHINGPLYRVKKNKCTNCGRCVKECPTGNIQLTQKGFKFSTKCAMCMRCAMNCPTDAIRIGFLNPWRVNGNYNYRNLVADASIPDEAVNDDTEGYFSLFRKYYRKADRELTRLSIALPRESAEEAEQTEEVLVTEH